MLCKRNSPSPKFQKNHRARRGRLRNERRRPRRYSPRKTHGSCPPTAAGSLMELSANCRNAVCRRGGGKELNRKTKEGTWRLLTLQNLVLIRFGSVIWQRLSK